MGRYRKQDGELYIASESGHGWTRGEGRRWTRSGDNGQHYELEKRRRNRKDDTYNTGWYLYSTGGGLPFFGASCGTRVLDAVDEADRMISEAERADREIAEYQAKKAAEDRWSKKFWTEDGNHLRPEVSEHYMGLAIDNADDTAVEEGFEQHSVRWYDTAERTYQMFESMGFPEEL
ncbi:hypothetical protein G5C51_41210 [Streptomyces sp. A7024]|uniref:Uncharacterized protein n=1 Tax=Streptomyces coryli TaxID=1128680 RepID=A0A6G4UEJ0_9ACTN|nr:hypothetical protein [Streptomyces coryli]NGN70290.1 hypothetical protein [Streptomyces coryli]